MKKSACLVYIIFFLGAGQACNNHLKDSKEIADSINDTKDTATTLADIITVGNNDARFATNAASASLAEISLANLALSKTTNNSIVAFANMVIKEHAIIHDELIALAKGKNIALPIAMGTEHQKQFDELDKFNGSEFDKKYTNFIYEDQIKILAFVEHQSRQGADPDLKVYAAKMTPMINAHLNAIKKIKGELK